MGCRPRRPPKPTVPWSRGLSDSTPRGEWSKVVEIVPADPEVSPDLSYYRGLALAKLGRWSQAHAAFASGQQKRPRDKRFPIELAGVDFKQKRFAEAETHLRRALRLDPGDSYALNFLATLRLLDQNLDAAVSLWNRIDKPWIGCSPLIF